MSVMLLLQGDNGEGDLTKAGRTRINTPGGFISSHCVCELLEPENPDLSQRAEALTEQFSVWWLSVI